MAYRNERERYIRTTNELTMPNETELACQEIKGRYYCGGLPLNGRPYYDAVFYRRVYTSVQNLTP